MTYMNVALDDLKKVLSEEDITWASNIRIPYSGAGDIWARKHAIDKIVAKAIEDGVVETIQSHFDVTKAKHYIVSDDLGGVVNPIDGKHYDSKSKYYRAVKAADSHIIEAGEGGKPRKQEGDYNVQKELREAIQQHLG